MENNSNVKAKYVLARIVSLLLALTLGLAYIIKFLKNHFTLSFVSKIDSILLGLSSNIYSYIDYASLIILTALLIIILINLVRFKDLARKMLNISVFLSILLPLLYALEYITSIELSETILQILKPYLSYIAIAILAITIITFILGAVFMCKNKGNFPYNASSYDLFVSIFWIVLNVVLLIDKNLLLGVSNIAINSIITEIVFNCFAYYFLITTIWLNIIGTKKHIENLIK